MSEYDYRVAMKYAELMTPAFVEGVSEIPDGTKGVTKGWMRTFNFQPPIRQILQEVDWDASGLPVKQWNRPEGSFGERNLLPGEYAERLIAFAFDDVYFILKLGEAYEQREGLPDGVCLKDVLLRSKKSLLSIGSLTDNDKQKVYKGFEYPELAELLYIELPLAEEALRLAQDRDGRWRFEWHENIQQFIDDNTLRDRGCPAHRIIIDDNGRKQSLMYHFWDKLIEAAYDE